MDDFLFKTSGIASPVTVLSLCDLIGVEARFVEDDLQSLCFKELQLILIYFVVKNRLFKNLKVLSVKEKMFIRCVQQDIATIHNKLELKRNWLDLWEKI